MKPVCWLHLYMDIHWNLQAERSDIAAKPNLYKLLYAFEMHRQNWRKAASYMYQYSIRLKKEAPLKENLQLSFALQERLEALSAAINALHLVHPAYAWIDSPHENYICPDQHSPNKKARRIMGVSCKHLKFHLELYLFAFHLEYVCGIFLKLVILIWYYHELRKGCTTIFFFFLGI